VSNRRDRSRRSPRGPADYRYRLGPRALSSLFGDLTYLAIKAELGEPLSAGELAMLETARARVQEARPEGGN
jgi:hypothetical protein